MGSLSRFSRDAASAAHRIYVPFYSKSAAARGGACASTFIDCFDPRGRSWSRATSIPGLADGFVLKDFSMVGLGRHIYVVGGRLCSADAVSCEDEARAVRCVRRYDVRSGDWETCAPMTNPRFNFACTVSEGRIYVAGGQSSSGWAEGISSAEVYDPALDQWRSLANMTMTRYNCVGVTWKGRIYAVGGFLGGRPFVDVVARSSVEVYDEKRDRWGFVPRMWNLDIPPYQIVVMNEKLFSSGDCYKPWKGHIEMYDEKENIWNVVHDSHSDFLSSASTERLYLTMAPIGNQLYFLAGYNMPGDDSRLRSEVHVFDTAADGEGWLSFETVEEGGEKELCGHCCVLKHES